ncbi:alpha/beta hydrolase [Pseudemcibacter aquimaris]|uniref:alpha/beta hydrolase n=1 Tax=Pseudemcibacter aquimaris TaxID=2857064 RepID=UPI002011BC2D|nr:alpha/beta hydrolase-fold protein [Pseudemcibacter aquimaris]MCC3861073.1 hypothetical protein [Pseudemcibacter aquimaris]WDU59891.1 hypothetical protein KW060_06435 [Pseudemcibacter aquimaris]
MKNIISLFFCFTLLSINSIAYAEIKETTINSDILDGSRQIKIYLPDDYADTTKKYPVFYVMDADFLFDPTVVISKTRAARDLMPESIIVGISTPNYAERLTITMPHRREPNEQINFEDSSPQHFLDFMEQELIPFIDDHYRTANYRGLIGMSPTVGPVLHGYFTSSKTFQAWLGFAANVQMYTIENKPITTKIIETAERLQGSRNWLYLSRGGIDIMRNDDLPAPYSKLQNAFDTPDAQVKIDIIENGEHYASAISSLDRAFSFIFPPSEWMPDYLSYRAGETPLNDLKEFYAALSEKYGFQTYPTNDGYWMGFSIAGTARYLVRNDRSEEAKKLLEWALEFSPKSAELLEPLQRLNEE